MFSYFSQKALDYITIEKSFYQNKPVEIYLFIFLHTFLAGIFKAFYFFMHTLICFPFLLGNVIQTLLKLERKKGHKL